jgi:hypothetical protein
MIKIAVVSFVTGFLVVALVLAGSVLALTMFADVQGWDSFARLPSSSTDALQRGSKRSSASVS